MIVGFNHNITYRDTSFHVQTEDGGIKRPQLVTLLYHGGTIIASQKTSYADIVKVDNLDHVVEELAKEQHKGMLRRVTKGEFDARIVEFGIPLGTATEQPRQTPPPPVLQQREEEAREDSLPSAPVEEPVTIVEEPIVDKFNQPQAQHEPSLDDLIYAYLTAGQKQ
ncbi:hypothetical protein SAMN05660420_00242 [Desulfuromusa kysingii]|uniref:Uncharacterized protein n=1 Tax=Desulfuromusa kysingii TaxID=37625 RepID=A0A1H3VT70_9BACT|nr:hypothetical protein [Desulfuromusa kysingii]SDZ77424.1 hypothetical protein SAMN05660420_00242 [Desulfuromusa kysingii]